MAINRIPGILNVVGPIPTIYFDSIPIVPIRPEWYSGVTWLKTIQTRGNEIPELFLPWNMPQNRLQEYPFYVCGDTGVSIQKSKGWIMTSVLRAIFCDQTVCCCGRHIADCIHIVHASPYIFTWCRFCWRWFREFLIRPSFFYNTVLDRFSRLAATG